MKLFLIITGVIMGISFLAYIFALLVDHFASVDGYDNPKDFWKISRKVFGYLFLISLIVFFITNFLGFLGLFPY